MLGHKWESAEGVIAESRTDMLAEQHGHHGHHGVQETRVYVVDVRMPSGRAFRASLPAPAGLRRELPVGTRVHLEVNEKTGEVRFDPSHPADHAPGQVSSLREAVHLARELRGEMAAGAAGVGVAGIAASLAGAAAAGHPGEGVRVVGGAEAAELVRELMGGG